VPDEVEFRTKPELALQLIDRAKTNGIQVKAWTADELYGRDGRFLDGLDERKEAFVVEIPSNAHAWLKKPKILRSPAKKGGKQPRRPPRLRRRDARASEVRNLVAHSPAFTDQTPQEYRIKDTQRGPQVWNIRWHTCWRKTRDERLVSSQGTLVFATNALTGENKFFLSNRVPGRDGWTLRDILRVAFARCQVEACFREAKEEVGLDHFECRGWRCIHRHWYAAILAQLFCARVRRQLSPTNVVTDGELVTMEQVRRAVDVVLSALDLPPRIQRELFERELECQQYHARRNAAASASHRKTRMKKLREQGIDPDRIKSVDPRPPTR
jgi:SRSO17 transposase